jgi:hypothetical protein
MIAPDNAKPAGVTGGVNERNGGLA